jgi:hypothetical protein
MKNLIVASPCVASPFASAAKAVLFTCCLLSASYGFAQDKVENQAAATVKEGLAASEKPAKVFEITGDDTSLYLALRRWSAADGHQLVWGARKDFPVQKTAYQANHLYEAIAMVMKDTEGSAYPLHACIYANKVVRVLSVSQSCDNKP